MTGVTFSRNDADSANAGNAPLLPGTYFVETRWNAASEQWQFRLIDDEGFPVPVADLSDDNNQGLVSNWQDIRDVSRLIEPDFQQQLVSRFASKRGVILDLSGQYSATGDSIVGAMRLRLSTDSASGLINDVAVAKYGILYRTVTDVSFVLQVGNSYSLNSSHSYYIQTRWDKPTAEWQFRLWTMMPMLRWRWLI